MATWDVTEPKQLTLDDEVKHLDVWFAHGKLRVIGADGPARIDIRRTGRRGLTMSLADGVLSLRHDVKSDRSWLGPFWWFGLGSRRYFADVTIAVPPAVAAGLTVISGSMVVSGLREGATLKVTSGSITMMGLGGQVRASTVSGSIESMGVAGDVSMETISGEIAIAESSAERVFARTISGSVTCDLDNPEAYDVRISTTSGGITVRVPSDADLEVQLGATSGHVTSAFPEIRGSGGPGTNSASGLLGSGRGTLRAHAVSGSIALLARASEHFEPRGDDS